MLKAHALRGMCTALGQVLVDHLDPWRRPTQRHGPLDQLILASRTFTVVHQLARGRLPDVDIRQLRTVRIGNLMAYLGPNHGCAPLLPEPGHPASAESGRRGIGPVAAARWGPGCSIRAGAPHNSSRGTVGGALTTRRVRAGAVSWCISSLPVSIA